MRTMGVSTEINGANSSPNSPLINNKSQHHMIPTKEI